VLLSGCNRLPLRSRYEPDPHICRLDALRIAQEISKCHGFCDSVRGIRILIYGFDSIKKPGECVFHTLASKPGRSGAGYAITLLGNSPFPAIACRFYVALELKYCHRLFRLHQG
jgi:hypothetical protein